jgi:hypothetical protein
VSEKIGFFERISAIWWLFKYKFYLKKQFKLLDAKRWLLPYKYACQMETIKQIVKYLDDGGGSFRILFYNYLNMHYVDAYMVGGGEIANRAILDESQQETEVRCE